MNADEKSAAARTPARPAPPRGPLGLRLIGLMKIGSGLLLAAAGFGIFRTIDRDLGASLEGFVTRLHLDPENRLVQETVSRVANIDKPHLQAIGAGTFFYAILHLVEGTGLFLVKRWAEYLPVFATASLLPVELYEVARKVTALRVGVMLVNVVVLVYVVARVRQQRSASRIGLDG
jgi:uncharacterized membrane protein (DUF2068 family)